ncbi:MAG: hypothetical protein E7405_04945, partial [Ruminococcaceae bacterium]|nr:hypothetical protein [Oscillospiraceae bacterium]
MKKFLILYMILCVVILSGCDGAKIGVNGPVENQVSYLDEKYEHKTFKIIDGVESGNLILAGAENSFIYALDANRVDILIDGKKAELKDLEDGMPIDVYCEGNFDNVPQKQGVPIDIICFCKFINGHSIGTQRNPGGSLYDLSGLYLKVLEDLWEIDAGL